MSPTLEREKEGRYPASRKFVALYDSQHYPTVLGDGILLTFNIAIIPFKLPVNLKNHFRAGSRSLRLITAMATSSYSTTQYPSDRFVESAGAILFDTTSAPRKACLLHYLAKDEWLLPKGRRNLGESRHDAAVREVREETGFPCRLYPVRMSTRAPSPTVGIEPCLDLVRSYPHLIEPFMLTVRELEGELGVKLIWWYIAVLDPEDENGPRRSQGEVDFRAEFFGCGEALEKLTFQLDRDILQRAISIVEMQIQSAQT